MQISAHIFAKRIFFNAVTPAGIMKRNVFVYLVLGEDTACLIDSGVASSVDDVLALLAEAGKQPEDISQILITHAHVDHIGGLNQLKQRLNCTVAASALSTPWIEDIDKEFRERPVPQFYEFAKESTTVDRTLQSGDLIQLGQSTLQVYEIPGHEKGQLAYFHQEDGVLFAADSVPIPGELPIYENLSDELLALKRLGSIENVQTLLMSWDDVRPGPEHARHALEQAYAYVAQVHQLTRQGVSAVGDELQAVAKYVHDALKLPPSTFNGLFFGTIAAHMNELSLELD